MGSKASQEEKSQPPLTQARDSSSGDSGEATVAAEAAPRRVEEPAGAPGPSAAGASARGSGASSAAGEQPPPRSSQSQRRPSGGGSGRSSASASAKRPGFLQQINQGYTELVNAIIRPPRAEYALSDLGPTAFRIAGRQYQRTDLQVRNARGLKLECSWWEPVAAERVCQELPCVVYMHGNSSCRLEALELLPLVLQTGCSLLAFDFAGCGLSEGEHITLGYHEKDDAKEVIDHLRASGKVSTIALWGRSMGAATALLHGHRDPSIAAMVLDSPFSSLKRLAREIIDQAQLRHKPEFMVKAFMRMMRSSVLKRSGLDILKLKPIEHVDTCYIPALFVAGNGDQFIPPQHTSDICEAYAGDKNLLLVEGNHNSRRPSYFMDSVSIFFFNRLCRPAGLSEEMLGLRPRVPNESGLVAAPRRRDNARGELGYPGSPVSGAGDAQAAAEDAELQEALLASLADSGGGGVGGGVGVPAHGGGDGVGGMAERLVGCATSQTQSTLPDRRTAAEALRA